VRELEEGRVAAGCGVEAREDIVLHWTTGVRWMKGFMRAWASETEARVRGRSLLDSAMLIVRERCLKGSSMI